MFHATRTFKAALIAATLASASGLALADSKDFTISVSADIPTAEFYVTASSEWNASQVQAFSYSNGALQKMTRNLEMKNTSGAIKAYLTKKAEMSGSGAGTVGIDVAIGDTTIPVGDTKAVSVVDKATAAAGKRVVLTLTPSATGTVAPGVYNGEVSLVFDSAI